MKKIHLLGILVLILMISNSCTNFKNLEKVKPKSDSASMAEEIQKLKAGDKIKVFEKSGSIRILEYVVTEEGVLRGFETKRTKEDLISIRVDDIVQMQVKRASASRIHLIIGGVILLLLVLMPGPA
jgi:hypothetical protein